MCEDSLCKSVNCDNVLDMLVLADLHGAASVRTLALKFTVVNGKEIVTQPVREKILRTSYILLKCRVGGTS